MKTQALLPLLLSLAYCLHLMQFAGVLLRNFLAALPSEVFMTALILTTGTALCLWRFRCLLEEKPELWALPALPADNADEAAAKSHAFAVAHNLSGREQELLAGMIRGASLEKISLEMGVALSTVRYHLTGLRKKTGTSSQRNVVSYFAGWRSEQS
jgi:DNA-binding CsgD family transcriptional regulator